MHNPLDLAGRRILVTGASSGIGRETAVVLSRLNARLLLVGRDMERLQAAHGMLEGSGHRAEVFDLAAAGEIARWLNAQTESDGPFAGLAHCAGVHAAGPVAVLSEKKVDDVLRSNVAAPLALVRALRQPGCFARGGSIVFVSSAAAHAGSPGLSLYAASKAALAGLTRSLAVELAREEIRVNSVVAGWVDTEMTARIRRTLTDAQFQAIVEQHPLGTGSARDVANAIAFLLADTARWITGSELFVDGGYTAH
jgi:NAD(P)-dependent dehydrogenase (short-subunit alcohol dehydrogenase family)